MLVVLPRLSGRQLAPHCRQSLSTLTRNLLLLIRLELLSSEFQTRKAIVWTPGRDSGCAVVRIKSMSTKIYRFAVVPKETVNPFYDQVYEGCQDMALLSPEAECVYVGPDSVNASKQALIIRDLIKSAAVDGISMAVIDEQIAAELADEALEAKIPFITFDSDAPNSSRLIYVGTDNFQFGTSLAKVLLQLRPQGGNYGIIDAAPPNLALRSAGIRDRLKNTRWLESPASPKDCLDSIPLSIQHMYDYASLTPQIDAIIPVGGWPMRNTTAWKGFVDAHRNLTLNVGDTDPEQLDLLSKTYVDGLVGQVPYQMGMESIRLLLELATGRSHPQEIFTTSLLEVVRIPLALPPVVVNENLIGNAKYLGYVGVGITYFLALTFVVFMGVHRKRRVVKASQPLFLLLIGIGVIIMVSSIIPLSVDDSGYTKDICNFSCMAFPWLLCMGFAFTFSALFSKTWRVNKLFRAHRRFVRQEVAEKDVIVPVISILASNILVLSIWTALAPLEYSRKPHPGNDDWNRIISTYGSCASQGALPYVVVLSLINGGLLVIANIQAYIARSIQSEFSESKYIGIIMIGMLQTCLIGVPIVFLVSDKPQVVYLVVTFMILFTCLGVLTLIFVPKMYFVHQYGKTREEVERGQQTAANGTLPSAHFYEDKRLRTQRTRTAWDATNSGSQGSLSQSYLDRSVGAHMHEDSMGLDIRCLHEDESVIPDNANSAFAPSESLLSDSSSSNSTCLDSRCLPIDESMIPDIADSVTSPGGSLPPEATADSGSK